MSFNPGRVWLYVVGPEDMFDLESRIFHAFTFLVGVLVFFNVPLKLILGLPITALLAGILAFCMAVSYYLSRFRGKITLGRNITYTSVNLLLALNYYYSGGMNGPTLLYFLFGFFATICVIPKKEKWIWITGNLVIVCILLFSELAAPSIVFYRQVSQIEKTADIFIAYLCIMVLIGTCATFLISSNNKEKNFVRQQLAILNVLDQERLKLMSIISHDLRAPLNNIHGYLRVATELDLSENEREGIQEDLLRSTKNTLEFLDNLLYWSRNRMSGIAHELREHNLLEIISPQCDLLYGSAAAKGVKLLVDIDENVKVAGNEEMIQLIVRNFLNNAIKYTAAGGTIVVDCELKRESCSIRVTDTGIGEYVKLPADIFESGYRSTLGTRQEKGFGLGLVLCKEFAEAQNGSISCESRPDGGSIFSLNLPLTVI